MSDNQKNRDRPRSDDTELDEEMTYNDVKTVEPYKSRAMEKLDVHNRVELVRYVARQGWLEG